MIAKGMKFNSIIITLFVGLFCQQHLVVAEYWPKPGSLLLFTPLDAENELRDIAKNKDASDAYKDKLEISKPGPFGIEQSSYTVSSQGWIAGYYNQLSFPSFTISTYFYVSGNQQKGGIFSFEGFLGSIKLSALYNGNSLEIHRFEINGEFLVESFTVRNFFSNDWTFLCLTYDDFTKTVTLYNQMGNPIFTQKNFPISNNLNAHFYLGDGYDDSDYYVMTPGDAMACTMIYMDILKSDEIAQLPRVCYFKGKGSPPALEPWPAPQNLIGLWPLSSQYKLNNINGDAFQSVRNTKICPITNPLY